MRRSSAASYSIQLESPATRCSVGFIPRQTSRLESRVTRCSAKCYFAANITTMESVLHYYFCVELTDIFFYFKEDIKYYEVFMKIKYSIKFILSVLMLFFIFSMNVFSQSIDQKGIDTYLSNLPFKMENLKLNTFPEKYFKIIEYGGIGNGIFKNTDAFKKCIEACSNAGGGYVIIPKGMWLTGPIELKSNINLHLEKGAMIIFSADHNDFPLIKYNEKSNAYAVANPIFGNNLNNIAITGEGIINGNGQTWRPVKKNKMTEGQWKDLINSGGYLDKKNSMWWPSMEAGMAEEYLSQKSKNDLTKKDYERIKDYYRPNLIYIINSKNILLDGPSFQNSPKFTININTCSEVIINNVKVFNEWYAQNGDGIDISACKNVLISNCTVNAGDDGICMKSGGGKKFGNDFKLQNIVIADCIVYHAHGGFVIGSNTDGGMKNISVSNCNFIFTDTGLRFKSGRGRGGEVKDIYIKDIFMKDIAEDAITFDLYYEDKGAAKTKDKEEEGKTPLFNKIYFNNIICDGAERAIYINGLPEQPVNEIEIKNAVFLTKKGMESTESKNIKIINTSFRIKTGALFNLKNNRDILLDGITCLGSPDIFINLEGAGTSGINIINTKSGCAKKNYEMGKDVNPKALIIK
jgi:polygalacturonase